MNQTTAVRTGAPSTDDGNLPINDYAYNPPGPPGRSVADWYEQIARRSGQRAGIIYPNRDHG